MSDTYQDIETRIKDAIHTIQGQESPNISSIARQFGVPPQRLYHRWHGRSAKTNLPGPNRRLSDEEERALCRYLDRLDRVGLPAQRELLRGAADSILAHSYTADLDNPNDSPPHVSNKWVSRFLKRHPEYTVARQKTLDLERKQAEGYTQIAEWYNQYHTERNEHRVVDQDT